MAFSTPFSASVTSLRYSSGLGIFGDANIKCGIGFFLAKRSTTDVYKRQVLDVDPKVNEKGIIEKIDIKTDKLRHTKKLKTAISNFYNMKESNINISE